MIWRCIFVFFQGSTQMNCQRHLNCCPLTKCRVPKINNKTKKQKNNPDRLFGHPPTPSPRPLRNCCDFFLVIWGGVQDLPRIVCFCFFLISGGVQDLPGCFFIFLVYSLNSLLGLCFLTPTPRQDF